MNSYEPYPFARSSDTDDDLAGVFATLHNLPFPYKLLAMLDNVAKEKMDAIVSWLPNNQSFKVNDQDAFAREILPRYFKTTKYKSFVRQLNIYGFERIYQRGSTRGGYFHKHFIRGEPRYCKYITREKIKQGVKGDLRTGPEVECHKVETSFAMLQQASATALSNTTIEDSLDDGDLVMFHGRQFYFVDAIVSPEPAPESYDPQQEVVILPPPRQFENKPKPKPVLSTPNQSSSPAPLTNKEFAKPHSTFYKTRTPAEVRGLVKRILGPVAA
jgi:hypothetical protein